MIAEKMQRDLDALRRQLSACGRYLPPLAVPLLNGLEGKLEGVAALERTLACSIQPRTPLTHVVAPEVSQ